MSMFVGAVMPRQKTAFALGGLKASAATKDVTATQLKRNMRITEFTGSSTRSWAVHSYFRSTSFSAAGVVRRRCSTNYQVLDVDRSVGRRAFVARRVERPFHHCASGVSRAGFLP
jgi:hypothetical protein